MGVSQKVTAVQGNAAAALHTSWDHVILAVRDSVETRQPAPCEGPTPERLPDALPDALPDDLPCTAWATSGRPSTCTETEDPKRRHAPM